MTDAITALSVYARHEQPTSHTHTQATHRKFNNLPFKWTLLRYNMPLWTRLHYYYPQTIPNVSMNQFRLSATHANYPKMLFWWIPFLCHKEETLLLAKFDLNVFGIFYAFVIAE